MSFRVPFFTTIREAEKAFFAKFASWLIVFSIYEML